MSQIFDLGPSYVFMIQNINNSEKIIFQNFYITYKNNENLNQNSETRFPRKLDKQCSPEIWHRLDKY